MEIIAWLEKTNNDISNTSGKRYEIININNKYKYANDIFVITTFNITCALLDIVIFL